MRIRYSHTYWGSDHLNPAAFAKAIAEAGYEGMELFLIPGDEISRYFMQHRSGPHTKKSSSAGGKKSRMPNKSWVKKA
jgi:hypothetical protein